ncbi:hypothetical protein GCM10023405_44190 [Streptomonospora salina]
MALRVRIPDPGAPRVCGGGTTLDPAAAVAPGACRRRLRQATLARARHSGPSESAGYQGALRRAGVVVGRDFGTLATPEQLVVLRRRADPVAGPGPPRMADGTGLTHELRDGECLRIKEVNVACVCIFDV